MPSQAFIWGGGPAQAQSQDRKGPGGLWEGVGAALKEGFEAESCSLSSCQLKNEISGNKRLVRQWPHFTVSQASVCWAEVMGRSGSCVGTKWVGSDRRGKWAGRVWFRS